MSYFFPLLFLMDANKLLLFGNIPVLFFFILALYALAFTAAGFVDSTRLYLVLYAANVPVRFALAYCADLVFDFVQCFS